MHFKHISLLEHPGNEYSCGDFGTLAAGTGSRSKALLQQPQQQPPPPPNSHQQKQSVTEV